MPELDAMNQTAQRAEPRPRIVAAIQARMGSTRLPGKALRPIQGRAMIGRIFDRLCYAKRLDAIVVACPGNPENDPIAAYCAREGIGCVRGPANDADVLGRMLAVAEAQSSDAVVRITADCPLVDPLLVDAVVERFAPTFSVPPCLRPDFISNIHPTRGVPDGLDVELISTEAMNAVRRYWKSSQIPEAFTTLFWSQPSWARTWSLLPTPHLGELRWTVDTPEDLAFVNDVWAALPESFAMEDIWRLHNDPHFKRNWAARFVSWKEK